ncbi:hypothetical protein Thermus77420_18220 [Thermus thalpophilus]
MRFSAFIPLFLLLALSACQPPTAGREVEVPLRLYRWQGEGYLAEPIPGEPLKVRVYLYRQGREVAALLRPEGGEAGLEGTLALVLEGPGGERAAEAVREGKASFLQVRGKADRPACVSYLVSLSPDPWSEELEVRLYHESGRVCEGGR